MTIRRRLVYAFLSILFLFGLNLAIYFVASARLSGAVEALQRAKDRQLLIANVGEDINDIHKQVTLTGNVFSATVIAGGEAESDEGAPSEAEKLEQSRFRGQLQELDSKLAAIIRISNVDAQGPVRNLSESCAQLAASWLIVHENFGSNSDSVTRAITELSVTAEPLSQYVRETLLPELEEFERSQAQIATQNYTSVSSVTKALTVGIFLASLLVAVVVAFHVSRYLTRGLSELEAGAAALGSGQLEMRLKLANKDELGDLAKSFNDMADKLLAAHNQLTEANVELDRGKKEVEKQQEMAMSLLLNILPVQVAEELQTSGQVEPKYFEDVTILFTDFRGFTLATEKLAAEELVYMLHEHFSAFDEIVKRYGIEKIKTIGDSYMCAGGIPDRKPSHPVDVVLAALEMARAVEEHNRKDAPAKWEVRIGVHTGSVIAGVVGTRKFAFDIWGDTVNYASRMESSSEPMKVNISERTYIRVKDFIECEARGKVLTKEKKELDMFFAKGIVPNLLNGNGENPPPAFKRRYRVYFQQDPPPLSEFLLKHD
ncbi:MAG: adenylate/guanylate cyclase domain-containing protein [Candidatus Hydrogenedentota bacterium]|mgnify:CR=1 FL=1